MKVCVLAVFDSAAKAFGRPLFVPAIGVAIRSFSDEVNRAAADNQMNQHPDDFVLHYIADFEEETGVFSVPEEGARMLARGKDVKKEA